MLFRSSYYKYVPFLVSFLETHMCPPSKQGQHFSPPRETQIRSTLTILLLLLLSRFTMPCMMCLVVKTQNTIVLPLATEFTQMGETWAFLLLRLMHQYMRVIHHLWLATKRMYEGYILPHRKVKMSIVYKRGYSCEKSLKIMQGCMRDFRGASCS